MKTTQLIYGITAAIFIASALRGTSVREVTVFSSVTVDGRKLPLPSVDQPVNCILVSEGYQEIGDGESAGASSPAAQVLNPLIVALTKYSFQCVRQGGTPPPLMILCHWGHATPRPIDAGPEFDHERAQMLALVGGEALGRGLPFECEAIRAAANEERFFMVVSAYDFAAYTEKRVRRLLWRTLMSVPSYQLSPVQAWPLLTATGAALFGHETSMPRRIDVNVSGILNPEGPAR